MDANANTSLHGIHVLADLYGCDPVICNDVKALTELIHTAAISAGAHVLGEVSHQFSPHGVTAIILLAESHLSIHTWPEKSYAAIDVFTCGPTMDPHKAISEISKVLKPSSSDINTAKRAQQL